MDYGRVLKRAWEITWRWKILWILGFLAALGSGGGGGSSSGTSSYTTGNEDWSRWFGHTYYGPDFTAGLIALIVGLGCLALIIGIAIWVVSVIARGGLIAGVQQVEEEGQTSFGQAWRAGARRFWSLFGISFLTAIPIIILVVGAIVALIAWIVPVASATNPSDAAVAMGILTPILCGGVFCCGLIIVSVILQQVRLYAERAAVLEDLGWIEAFVRGWKVLKANLGATIVFWVIFFAIGLVLMIAVGIVLVAVMVPIVAVGANVDPGPWILAPICGGGLIAVIVGSLISAIVETFTSATWTLAYREMVGMASAPVVAPAPAGEPEGELAIEAGEEPAPEE
ncbi:MAG: hypothetical protein ACK2U9_22965 [Anaerolineae bacterium]